MKKKDETRYFVTSVASVPVYKVASKTEMYRMATKPGWGAVEWYSAADGYKNPVARDRSDKTQQLCCDEDTSASLYTKNGGYFGIFPYEEINAKEMPKQAEVAAIIYSDSCGYSVWAEDFNQIHFFVTYDENDLIDSYRVEYGDSPIYDGEVEVAFEDLFQQPEGDWRETYRAELPGTVEYQFKQEADALAQEAGETWMDGEQREQFRQVCGKIDRIKSARDFNVTIPLLGYDYDKKIIEAAQNFKNCHTAAQYETERETRERVAQEAREAAADQPAAPAWMDKAQQEDFREICGMIDSIKSGRDFYRVMNLINGGRYSVDVINAAREFKQCFNSAQYEPEAPSAGTLVAVAAGMVERDAAADVEPQPIALAYTDDLGIVHCGECGAELLCSGTGDMPDVCPACGRRLEYDFFREPEGPDADAYRTRADNQQGAGTAAEAASEGRETALGTPEAMAGTDATEAAGGQQPPPQAGGIDLGRLYAGTRLEAMEQEEGKQPGGP